MLSTACRAGSAPAVSPSRPASFVPGLCMLLTHPTHSPSPTVKTSNKPGMATTFTTFSVVLSLLQEVLPLETLPSLLHFGLLVCLETKQIPAFPGCNTSTCLIFVSYFVIPFRVCTVIILHVDPTLSIIILFRLTGSHIMNSFATQYSHCTEWMPE